MGKKKAGRDKKVESNKHLDKSNKTEKINLLSRHTKRFFFLFKKGFKKHEENSHFRHETSKCHLIITNDLSVTAKTLYSNLVFILCCYN